MSADGRWHRVQVADHQVPGQLPIRVLHAGIARWARGATFASPVRTHFHLALVTFGDAWFEQDGRRHYMRAGESASTAKRCATCSSTCASSAASTCCWRAMRR